MVDEPSMMEDLLSGDNSLEASPVAPASRASKQMHPSAWDSEDSTLSKLEEGTSESMSAEDQRRVLTSASHLSTSNFMDWRKSEKAPKPSRSQAWRDKRPWLSRQMSRLEALQLYAEELEHKDPEDSEHNDRCTRFFFRHLSKPLDNLSMLVILVNVYFVVLTTNNEIKNPTDGRSEFVLIVDWCFTGFYVFELMVRLYTERYFFFFGRKRYWYYLDTMLVVASLLADSGIGFLRALRILRAAKVVRAAKFIRFYKVLKSGALEIMVNCLAGSVNMLFWCVVMIAFFTFLFSVFFVQAIAEHLNNKERAGVAIDQTTLDNFGYWFGTVQGGMISLLMVTTGGTDWIDVWESIAPAGWHASAAFVFYILLFTIAVWNVVTSTFVDKALRLAKASDDTVVTEARLQARQDAKELRATFARMDMDGSGKLDCDEFASCMKKPEFERWLQTRGLDIKETRTFFRMLARNQESVDIDTIVHACMKMRGQATSIDLHTMRYELRKIQQTLLSRGAGGAHEEAGDSTAAACAGGLAVDRRGSRLSALECCVRGGRETVADL
jgi:hypothetical protein